MGKRTGRPNGRPPVDPVLRFEAKVERTETCWLWNGSRTPEGYGSIWVNGRKVGAHRFSYELHVGPIPIGYQLDHLCRVPPCVNPAHLEAVTPRENYLRGESPLARNARKTACKRGHDFTEANTIRVKRGRMCRTCRNASRRRQYQTKKQRTEA